MGPDIEIERLRLPRPPRADMGKSLPRLPRHGPRERFLKGPIPWEWLASSARLPGKALHVALELWHWAGITGKAQVKLSMSEMELLGVSRYSGARGLKALEGAGLVSAIRHRGRHPLVTILKLPVGLSSSNPEAEVSKS